MLLFPKKSHNIIKILLLIVYLNIFVSIYMVFTSSVVKKDAAELLTAVSLGETDNVTKLLSTSLIDQQEKDKALELALKLNKPDIANILLDHGVDVGKKTKSNTSLVDELFRFTTVDTIEKVVPNISPDLYMNNLDLYIINGLHVEAKYKNRMKHKHQTTKDNIYRMVNNSRYIVENLASQRNIISAVSGLCSMMMVEKKGIDVSDSLQYLIGHVDKKPPEITIGCLRNKNGIPLEYFEQLLEPSDINTPINLAGIDRLSSKFNGRSILYVLSDNTENVNVELLRLLDSYDVIYTDKDVIPILENLIYKDPSNEAIEFLLSKNIDLNARDDNGKTLLIKLIEKNPSGAGVKFLIDRNVDVNIKDNTEKAALHWFLGSSYTRSHGNPDELELLLERLIKDNSLIKMKSEEGLNLIDKLSWGYKITEYIVAYIYANYPEALRSVIKTSSADLGNLDKLVLKWRLYQASLVGDFDTVKLLVGAGAAEDNYVKNHRYFKPSPIYYARKYGHNDIVDYLVSQGVKQKPKELLIRYGHSLRLDDNNKADATY